MKKSSVCLLSYTLMSKHLAETDMKMRSRRQNGNKGFSYQDTPLLHLFLVCILNFDKTSKIFSKCNHLFGRYLGETHFVHKSRAVTLLKNKEKQNVIG